MHSKEAKSVHKFHVFGSVDIPSYVWKWWNFTTIELCVKCLQQGWNSEFDPFLERISIKSSRAYHVLEPMLEVGWNVLKFLLLSWKPWEKFNVLNRGFHGVCLSKSSINLRNASLARDVQMGVMRSKGIMSHHKWHDDVTLRWVWCSGGTLNYTLCEHVCERGI